MAGEARSFRLSLGRSSRIQSYFLIGVFSCLIGVRLGTARLELSQVGLPMANRPLSAMTNKASPRCPKGAGQHSAWKMKSKGRGDRAAQYASKREYCDEQE